jgi:FtsP/CotA-like multicopper oxidase with cupredoxin domain
MNRRDALYNLSLGAVGLASGRLLSLGTPQYRASSTFEPDVDLSLVAAPDTVQIRAGEPTRVWRFTGSVIKGAPSSLQVIPGSYLGPIIRLRRGQKVRIHFRNSLPEPSIVHWHGLDVPEAADGHPHLAIAPGGEYVYEFEVVNRAGSCWYHPHPHGRTGHQVHQGMAGLLIVTDDEEAALGLPSGANDLVCVLQDRTFDERNQLTYLAGGMMDRMHGLLGERMLVNGTENATLALATRAYRIRVLNASSSRVYKLVWNDGTPMTIIGADGGLLEQPITQPFLTIAPAQRADLILDLRGRSTGTSMELRSAPFRGAEVSIDESGMMGGMGGGMGRRRGAGGALPNGAPLLLMTVRVTQKVTSSFRLPARLTTYGPDWALDHSAPVRRITLDFRAGQWLLGGRTFDMMDVAPDETVRAGSTHIWELANIGGMMGQQMAHPFHVHGTQFRVISRVNPDAPGPQSVREGLVDAGWRDTVMVMPRDVVRLQVRFTDYRGLFLYHCHLLEHEDMGMMRNFRVTD